MRVDQILNYNWKFLVPLSLVLIFFVALVDKLIPDGTSQVARMAVHLVLNLVIAFFTLEILRRRGRQFREAMSGGDGPGGREVLHPEDHGPGGTGHGPTGHGSLAHEDQGDLPLGGREPVAVPIH